MSSTLAQVHIGSSQTAWHQRGGCQPDGDPFSQQNLFSRRSLRGRRPIFMAATAGVFALRGLSVAESACGNRGEISLFLVSRSLCRRSRTATAAFIRCGRW